MHITSYTHIYVFINRFISVIQNLTLSPNDLCLPVYNITVELCLKLCSAVRSGVKCPARWKGIFSIFPSRPCSPPPFRFFFIFFLFGHANIHDGYSGKKKNENRFYIYYIYHISSEECKSNDCSVAERVDNIII